MFFTKKRREFICVRVSKAPGKLLLEITATARRTSALTPWILGFHKAGVSQRAQGECGKGREILSNSSGNFSTWKNVQCFSSSKHWQMDSLSTRGPFSFGYCHQDIPLPDVFQTSLCICSQDVQDFLGWLKTGAGFQFWNKIASVVSYPRRSPQNHREPKEVLSTLTDETRRAWATTLRASEEWSQPNLHCRAQKTKLSLEQTNKSTTGST